MRILVLSNVPPGAVGGAEVQTMHLARRWAACGHSVIVAGHANQAAADGNVSVVHISTWQRIRVLRAVSYVANALWLLWRRRAEYDVIYCRFLREQAFSASLARSVFSLRQPLVACPACASRGGEVAYLMSSPFKWIWVAAFGRGVTVVNAMSQQIEREVRELGLVDVRVSKIPNGVVLPPRGGRLGRRGQPFSIIFVGRLVEQKGLHLLLDAVKLLREAGRVFKLRLVGDGPLRGMIEERVRELSIDECVAVVGPMAPEQVTVQLADADLFVLPSLFEGMPGALLEAIAHGLPAVVTRVSGSEEIIDDSIGWVVPVGDACALANAIGEALDMDADALEMMGWRARSKAVREYDIDFIATQYLKLFEDLISK